MPSLDRIPSGAAGVLVVVLGVMKEIGDSECGRVHVHACVNVSFVAVIKSCDQPHVNSSEIVFGDGRGFVLYAEVSRISFNNGRKICGY